MLISLHSYAQLCTAHSSQRLKICTQEIASSAMIRRQTQAFKLVEAALQLKRFLAHWRAMARPCWNMLKPPKKIRKKRQKSEHSANSRNNSRKAGARRWAYSMLMQSLPSQKVRWNAAETALMLKNNLQYSCHGLRLHLARPFEGAQFPGAPTASPCYTATLITALERLCLYKTEQHRNNIVTNHSRYILCERQTRQRKAPKPSTTTSRNVRMVSVVSPCFPPALPCHWTSTAPWCESWTMRLSVFRDPATTATFKHHHHHHQKNKQKITKPQWKETRQVPRARDSLNFSITRLSLQLGWRFSTPLFQNVSPSLQNCKMPTINGLVQLGTS